MSSKAPTSPSLNSTAALYLQRQIQQSLTSGASGFSTVAAQALLKQQEDQLRATRLLLQQHQLDAVAPSSAPSSRSSSILARDPMASLLALSGSTSSATSAAASSAHDALAALAAVRRSSVQSVASAASVCEAAAKVAAEEDSEDEAEEEISDEEYFKNYVAEAASQDSDVEDRANNESFPHKLYRMLYEVEREGLGAIVSFLPSGRGFTIHKPKDFVAEIMPRYFTTRRVASFQRQLNLYGFRRISEGKEKGAYFHKYFVKGKRSRVQNIKRKSTAVARPAPSAFAHQFAAASSLQFPSAPPTTTSSLSGILGAAANVSATSSIDNATKELLLARYAANALAPASSTSSTEASLLEMARLRMLANTNSSSVAASQQDFLRSAAASLLFKNNPNRFF